MNAHAPFDTTSRWPAVTSALAAMAVLTISVVIAGNRGTQAEAIAVERPAFASRQTPGDDPGSRVEPVPTFPVSNVAVDQAALDWQHRRPVR